MATVRASSSMTWRLEAPSLRSSATLGRSARTAQPSATITFNKAGVVSNYVVDVP